MIGNSLIHHKQRERFFLLYNLYRKSQGNSDTSMDMRRFSEEEGMNFKSFKSAYDYLWSEEMIRPRPTLDHQQEGSQYHAAMTTKGIKAVEDVFKFQTEETEYFPSYLSMM